MAPNVPKIRHKEPFFAGFSGFTRSWLTRCPVCGHEVSRTAVTCPHCGHRLRRPVATFFLFLFLAFCALWTYGSLNPPNNLPSPPPTSSVSPAAPTEDAFADPKDTASRAQLTEIIAFIRLAAFPCTGTVPYRAFETLSPLLIPLMDGKHPIAEEEIKAKETEVQQFRSEFGDHEWCALYTAEMGKAQAIIDSLNRNAGRQ
jgi:hypothetical protein